MIHITNTLSHKKERIDSKKITMYVCGITPYDYAHVGHGRCYVAFDVLYRLLTFFEIDVTYCRNFTDIDDKLLRRAELMYGDKLRYRALADKYIARFQQDMNALNCVTPQMEPRVTDNMNHIIHFIEKLMSVGHAYQCDGDVYFDIETFIEYGKLSGQRIEQLHEGVRVDVREEKKNPLDFALWKSEAEGEFWLSPWGYGRPGWHIECSVLAKTYLSEHIDIHGGGLDLLFPHHENEIAQSESLYGTPYARMWVHNGFVTINNEKMSKSLGNFFVLHELFERFDPMVVRYFFLMHHYRAPLEFSFELLEIAQKNYERLVRMFSSVDASGMYDHAIVSRMMEFLQDDMNTPGMLGVLFEQISAIADDKKLLSTVKNIFVNILGLTFEPLAIKEVEITPDIQLLIDERRRARQEKNWKRSDELREQLKVLGIDVSDEKIDH